MKTEFGQNLRFSNSVKKWWEANFSSSFWSPHKKILQVNNWYLCGFDNVLILVLFCANPLEVNDHWFFFSLSMKRWEFATIHWWELAVMMLKVLKFATLTMKLLAKPLTKPTKLNKTNLSVEWKSWPNAKMSNVSLI